MNEIPDLTTLTSEQKDELIRQLFPLLEEVRKLTARVSELEARVSKNSQNSSKPHRRMAMQRKHNPCANLLARSRVGKRGILGRRSSGSVIPMKSLPAPYRLAAPAVPPCPSLMR